MTAAIWIDPSRQEGHPCLNGTRTGVDTLARYVAHMGVNDTLIAFEIPAERRRDVLVCVAWWVLYGRYLAGVHNRKTRLLADAWFTWAETTWRDCWHADHMPDDPPEVTL